MALEQNPVYLAFLIFSACTLVTLFVRKHHRAPWFYFFHGWALVVLLTLPLWLLNMAWAIPLKNGVYFRLMDLAYISLFSAGGCSLTCGFVAMDMRDWLSDERLDAAIVVFVFTQTALVAWLYSRRAFLATLSLEDEVRPGFRFFLWHPGMRWVWIIFLANAAPGLVLFFAMYDYVVPHLSF